MALKYCAYCSGFKFFDQTAGKKDSKATGFFGGRCWDCFTLETLRKARRDRASKEGRALATQYALTWKRENRGHATALTAEYKAEKSKRTPLWADRDHIKLYYIYANALGLEVDHIIPLRGKLVSGLHVHNNLQLMTKSENSSKGAAWH